MTRCTLLFGSMAFLILPGLFPQDSVPSPVAMPSDRAYDSYRIYSSLIPLGETAGKGWPHDLSLVRDATITAVPVNQPCAPPPPPPGTSPDSATMNPHIAVKPSPDRQQDFREILEDFDRHCHEQFQLDVSLFTLSQPVHLLTPAEQKEFESTRMRPPDKYKGASALYAFSAVYFNERHTVALVYATHFCGGLCGEGFWIAFGLKNGKWKELHWNAASWIS